MLPKKLFSKYLTRFDELIAEGEVIQKTIKVERYVPTERTMDYEAFGKWEINCESLLDQVIPSKSIHRKIIESPPNYYTSEFKLKSIISVLRALKEDYEKGFLEDLALQIEAELAADYMGQAEQLLAEGQTGKYDHVPAAVLSGAVLEKALRTLCDKQSPPVLTVNTKGQPLTLNPLIDALKKVGAFNESVAKQLRAWADIRNDAAHGDFDQFTRSDVELMIQGINNFLATYMV
jgi:hypothetical protein